jgi:hypothetical protein
MPRTEATPQRARPRGDGRPSPPTSLTSPWRVSWASRYARTVRVRVLPQPDRCGRRPGPAVAREQPDSHTGSWPRVRGGPHAVASAAPVASALHSGSVHMRPPRCGSATPIDHAGLDSWAAPGTRPDRLPVPVPPRAPSDGHNCGQPIWRRDEAPIDLGTLDRIAEAISTRTIEGRSAIARIATNPFWLQRVALGLQGRPQARSLVCNRLRVALTLGRDADRDGRSHTDPPLGGASAAVEPS